MRRAGVRVEEQIDTQADRERQNLRSGPRVRGQRGRHGSSGKGPPHDAQRYLGRMSVTGRVGVVSQSPAQGRSRQR